MCFSLTTSLAQLLAPAEMRGRVVSIYMVAFRGGSPLGGLRERLAGDAGRIGAGGADGQRRAADGHRAVFLDPRTRVERRVMVSDTSLHSESRNASNARRCSSDNNR